MFPGWPLPPGGRFALPERAFVHSYRLSLGATIRSLLRPPGPRGSQYALIRARLRPSVSSCAAVSLSALRWSPCIHGLIVPSIFEPSALAHTLPLFTRVMSGRAVGPSLLRRDYRRPTRCRRLDERADGVASKLREPVRSSAKWRFLRHTARCFAMLERLKSLPLAHRRAASSSSSFPLPHSAQRLLPWRHQPRPWRQPGAVARSLRLGGFRSRHAARRFRSGGVGVDSDHTYDELRCAPCCVHVLFVFVSSADGSLRLPVPSAQTHHRVLVTTCRPRFVHVILPTGLSRLVCVRRICSRCCFRPLQHRTSNFGPTLG